MGAEAICSLGISVEIPDVISLTSFCGDACSLARLQLTLKKMEQVFIQTLGNHKEHLVLG